MLDADGVQRVLLSDFEAQVRRAVRAERERDEARAKQAEAALADLQRDVENLRRSKDKEVASLCAALAAERKASMATAASWQAERERSERLREALKQIAAWSWDSGSIPAPEVVSRIYCEARAALAPAQPAQAAADSIMAAKAHPASKLEAKWRTINPAHVKHHTGDYCIYCQAQWPCEEGRP